MYTDTYIFINIKCKRYCFTDCTIQLYSVHMCVLIYVRTYIILTLAILVWRSNELRIVVTSVSMSDVE